MSERPGDWSVEEGEAQQEREFRAAVDETANFLRRLKSVDRDILVWIRSLLTERDQAALLRAAAQEFIDALDEQADRQEPSLQVVVRRSRARTNLRRLLEQQR